MPRHEQIQCPRCGQEFECKLGSITICHCSEVKLSAEQRSYIAERWDRCLCHTCLLEIKALFDDPPATDILSLAR
ncbi:MAG: cysteine-rich CWC family protein [Pseudomonadota bacterium]